MTSPDPAFAAYFSREFPRRLDRVEIPGMPGASWDRKAAWLLWTAEGNSPSASEMKTDSNDTTDEADIFG